MTNKSFKTRFVARAKVYIILSKNPTQHPRVSKAWFQIRGFTYNKDKLEIPKINLFLPEPRKTCMVACKNHGLVSIN